MKGGPTLLAAMASASASAFACVVAFGCGTSAFDDRQRQAWSDSRSRPGGVSSRDYGVAVTTVDREEPGCTIVVAGDGPASVSTLTFDVDGDFSHHGLEVTDTLGDAPVVAGALDAVVGGKGTFALADRAAPGRVQLYDARTGDDGPTLRATLADDVCAHLGGNASALAFGLTGESDLNPDLAAVSGGELALLRDVTFGPTSAWPPACLHCTLPAPGAALAIGQVDGMEGEDIVVLVGAGPSAQLIAITAAQLASSSGGPCAHLVITGPPGGQAFAPPLAVGDIDEGDLPEIAVGSAARDVVYVVRDVGGPVTPPQVVTIAGLPDSMAFGTTLVFGDFDGDDLEELAVGDPDATPEGVGSGQVNVLRWAGDEFLGAAKLFDSEPVLGQRFGRALDVAEFGVGGGEYRDVLLVAAAGELFTYFKVFPGVDDPRY